MLVCTKILDLCEAGNLPLRGCAYSVVVFSSSVLGEWSTLFGTEQDTAESFHPGVHRGMLQSKSIMSSLLGELAVSECFFVNNLYS
jgi:hypothetical protein